MCQPWPWTDGRIRGSGTCVEGRTRIVHSAACWWGRWCGCCLGGTLCKRVGMLDPEARCPWSYMPTSYDPTLGCPHATFLDIRTSFCTRGRPEHHIVIHIVMPWGNRVALIHCTRTLSRFREPAMGSSESVPRKTVASTMLGRNRMIEWASKVRQRAPCFAAIPDAIAHIVNLELRA